MTETERCFLDAYRCSLLKEDYDQLNKMICTLPQGELRQILAMADMHLVFPMVFESLYNSLPSMQETAMMQRRLEKAIAATNTQARRTAEFLKLIQFLTARGLSPIVVKGIICRELYPDPEQRPSTDEDLLIYESQFEQYHSAFLEYGLVPVSANADINQDYEVSYANSHLYIELHKTLFPPESVSYGSLNRFFADADSRKTTAVIHGVPVTTMGPTDHLFYQICHAYKHFLNCGIGIRLVSDIVLYSLHYMNHIDWEKIREKCMEIEAFEFVSAIYMIGEKYLFNGHYLEELKSVWHTDDVDERPLLKDILAGGLYGSSSEERLHSANITLGAAEAEKTGAGHSVLKRTLFPPRKALQNRYPYLRKMPFLLPAAWVQRLLSYLSDSLFHKKADGIGKAVRIGKERVAIMHGYRMLGSHKKDSFFRRIYKRSQTSAIAPFMSLLFHAVSALEFYGLEMKWFLQGERRPSQPEKELVKENVTFIAKSFERLGLAKGLCRNISRLYPGARIIIADDSRVPLTVNQDNVTVINLPYNSGLGAGLKAALEQVKTPYVMRMDDDELLTICSRVHRELQYLMKHEELDLIGFGHTTAIRLRRPQTYFREYYRTPMKDAPLELIVPHLTRLDGNHVVLGKVANIYLARTEKLRKVGFDPEIRVIDHHEFFWRAAGILTCAAALDTVVFHRHDPYNRNYNLYRSDYRADLEYIERKRSRTLQELQNEKKTN